MKVFWSWQNDYAPKCCRHFVKGCLEEAIKGAADDLRLEDAERPDIDHDTKDTPGMTDITATILDKISRCAVFVADLTPIGRSPDGKALPNPNVLIELGWALGHVGPDRIIAVLNTASGFKPDDLPFDIRHRRALTYDLSPAADTKAKREAQKLLTANLAGALRANLKKYIDEDVAKEEITGIAAASDNRSIWATAFPELTHGDAFAHARQQSVLLPDCPRGYVRLIPSGWTRGVPSVGAFPQDEALSFFPPSRGHSGDYGICEQGYTWYIITGRDGNGLSETKDVTMFFDETGEFWILNGSAICTHNGRTDVGIDQLVSGWACVLAKGMSIMDKLGAHPTRKVEAGLVGIKGALWPGTMNYDSPVARKNQCHFDRQHRDWSADAQLQFITDTYNRVRDLFGLPDVRSEDGFIQRVGKHGSH